MKTLHEIIVELMAKDAVAMKVGELQKSNPIIEKVIKRMQVDKDLFKYANTNAQAIMLMIGLIQKKGEPTDEQSLVDNVAFTIAAAIMKWEEANELYAKQFQPAEQK